MQNTSYKLFNCTVGAIEDEFKVNDLIVVKSELRQCISIVETVLKEQVYDWDWHVRARSIRVLWHHPTKANPVICSSLIVTGDLYINFGNVLYCEFEEKYPEFFI